MCGDAGMAAEPRYPAWARAAACASGAEAGAASRPAHGGNQRVALHDFCGVCWYFAQALTDALRAAGRSPPTLGLACVAAVGSQIEDWLPERGALLRECRHPMPTDVQTGHFYTRRLAPYARMSLKGWVWYQGESNLRTNAVSGNSAGRLGYGCELPLLVREWRAL
eukprot:999189-Prymnesium_polylepis.1